MYLQSVDELVLRGFNYCVIDEVDSILIDEARTPLIISGLAEKPSDRYYKAAKIAAAFERDIHYTVRRGACLSFKTISCKILVDRNNKESFRTCNSIYKLYLT